MMFEAELTPVVNALVSGFGSVHDLFADLPVYEHRNELLLFGGIGSVTCKETVSDGSGGILTKCEVVYSVSLYGKRGMGAKELCGIFDERALPALGLCGGEIKTVKRLPCEFSREHGGYIVSAELTFFAGLSGTGILHSVEFSAAGVSYSCMTGFEVSGSVKTADTPLMNGTIRTRKIGNLPEALTVKGSINRGGMAVYSALKPLLGTAVSPLNVAGMDFSGMMLKSLKISGKADGMSEITAEFSGVDEI